MSRGMSFIPKDERDQAPAKSTAPDDSSKPTTPPKDSNSGKKSGKGSALRSAFWLCLILLGLFLGRPYLTGEKSLGSVPSLSLSSDGDALEATAPVTELQVPMMLGDKEMRRLMREFKEGYERLVPAEERADAQPRVRAAKFSKDRKKLLIELETNALTPPSTDDAPAQRIVTDVIFIEDEFGRMITASRYTGITLYPAEQ